MSRTDYERIEADPRHRPGLRKEEVILEVTEAIVEELERQKITKADLAARLGKTRGFVTQILSGGRNLTLGTIAEVADALGCRVSVRLQTSGRPAVKRARARRATSARRQATT
jgi:transcriptional regulator with XRE-family HTH domain